MPSIGIYHPIVVHFAIALLVAGVILRLISLTGRVAFAGPAAAALLLTGALASVVSAKSGDDAHGPVERVPGARDAVEEHEEWGERARNVFVGVAALEIAALLLAKRGKAKMVHVASGLVGLAGLFVLYEAGEHGGELVYAYAGGVGVRSEKPEDVGRLLLAGLYHQSQLDRQSGDHDEAAALIELALHRFPNDIGVRLLAAESLLVDRHDAAAALAALDEIEPSREQRMLRFRRSWLLADVYEASGQNDAAREVLESLKADFPTSGRLQRRLEQSGSEQ